MNRISKIALFSVTSVVIIGTVIFGSFYTWWNKATPVNTCASCHEIGRYVSSQVKSVHRNLKCEECHGTALSNGWHSMEEKGMMVVNHLKGKKSENIKMSEKQLLEVIDQCRRCHSSEYAMWTSGGHSVDYQHIFLNSKHNSTEQINFDCLRCHGMFFKGSVGDLVEPLTIKGPWKLKNATMAAIPAIPCMTCHQIHQDGMPQTRPDYSNPDKTFYQRESTASIVYFYDRHEKSDYPVAELPRLNLWEGERKVKVSDDLIMRNCVQCHAPDAQHQAGTGDDKTPRGVHEGLSCTACHQPHSNSARNSCTLCHPAVSNCKIDVTKMNTSYADSKSPNNIHFVSCKDCHKGEKLRITTIN